MFRWLQKPAPPEIPLDEIKKRTRLLVIDDADFPYQELFKRDGYTIDKWSDVIDLPKLENGLYDIILLDLQGVGREQSSEQGLGILRHLRRAAPTQVIIAYSNADWSLKYQEFFGMADAVLAKSSDYVDFKKTVDTLLAKRFTIGFYTDKVQDVAAGSVNDRTRLDRMVRDAIQSHSTARLAEFLNTNVRDAQIIATILNIVQIAIGVLGLWKH